jgi:hypothetical protein
MGEWAIHALVIGFFGWVVWSIVRGRYAWEIRIKHGQPEVRKGKVTAAFLAQVTEECQATGVTRGWIGGVFRGRRVSLFFSRDFSPGMQQRLRNAWQSLG